MKLSLQSRWYERLERQPDQRAIAFYDNRGEYSWYSVENFHARAAGYAAQLAEHGLHAGDVCVLVLPSTEFAATTLMATLLLGAVPLLIAPPVLQAEASHSSLADIVDGIVNKTNPRLVIYPQPMESVRERLEAGHHTTRFLFATDDVTSAGASTVPTVLPADTDIAAMQLTSGTTGFPRVCVWQQQSVLAALDGMAVAMALNTDDICLNWTPLYHDMGLVNNFLLAMTYGVPLVMLNPHDFVRKPAIWLRSMHDTGTTVTWSPNFGFAITAQRVREKEIDGVRLDNVRGFWNAAERIHYDTLVAFEERFTPYGLRDDALKTNFGCAENIGGATFSAPDDRFVVEHIDRTLFQDERIAKPVEDADDSTETVTVVGVGRPHPGITITILSNDLEPLPDGHVGEIGLDTPSRMEGYLGDDAATAGALRNGLLRTGDLGYMRDGELFWVGRSRERITVRGKKFDPSDFESVLLGVSGLRHGNFAAFGVDDSAQGTQRIVIVSEVRDPASVDLAEIAGDIRNQTMLRLGVTVNEVILVEAGTLTKTSSGKRRHRYFHDLYSNGGLTQFQVYRDP